MKSFIILIATIISFAFADDVYQYTDKNGRQVYTNKPVKNATKMTLPALTIYTPPKNSQTKDNVRKIYPKENYNSYLSNPTGRQLILAEELSKEKQALADTKDAIAQAKKTPLASEKNNKDAYNKRIQALQDAITEHQKNIDVLSKQLNAGN
ncbi:MAG: DUF4124 domain-containing protein [Burkholderiales bacterium]|nr:DUF4124 domain-containing protein [Burkholderiales bacterium]